MLFNSLHYFVFLPLVVVLYYLIQPKFRWILIFIASCYFYMAFVPKYILILFLIIIIDYVSALTIEQVHGRLKVFYLVASLTANVLLLAFFKYFAFLNDNLELVFSLFGKDYHRINLDIILPIGLSFHTFQSMAYTIEVYRGNQKAETHLGYFANYVLFFPQMVAGPIERYATLGKELKSIHTPLYQNFADGFKLILFGLFVKMTIADNLAPFVNQVYADPSEFSSPEVLASVFAFSFQIYADFFGYSTIALGSAKLLGITIMDNFKTPYLSKSVTEFWTRWHISLSTWFRDYLYISIGGNRVSIPRWAFNIMLVFMVSGLWHGASWTFVVWGALHGVMLLTERLSSKLFKFEIKQGWSFINLLLCLKTFIITSFIWIFFRAESFGKAKAMIKSILHWRGSFDMSKEIWTVLAIALVVIAFDVFYYNSRFELKLNQKRGFVRWAVYAVLIFSLLALSGAQKFAFIYFQF
ncbi:MAG: MBOAT family protein [Bacteroidia bacterium]|jgi:D-alanyl-lipoteichoic acid acyltransferase DltB (MBOAT superfamily)|nr:MBOAT family protein [Bacteroidia bacterium]